MNTYELHIPATLEAVSELSQQVDVWLKGVPDDVRGAVSLAAQELGVNIVEHAYEGQTGMIEVKLVLEAKRLKLQFSDDAPNAYNTAYQINLPNPEDLPEGGWGMFLIYELMDGVEYERLSDGNRWYLVKQWGN